TGLPTHAAHQLPSASAAGPDRPTAGWVPIAAAASAAGRTQRSDALCALAEQSAVLERMAGLGAAALCHAGGRSGHGTAAGLACRAPVFCRGQLPAVPVHDRPQAGQPRPEPAAAGAVLELPGVDPGPDQHALSLARAPAWWLGAAGLPPVAGGGDGVLSDAVQDPLCRWSGAVSA